jgi:hypothetical protein
MSDLRISELAALAGVSLASNDLLPIVDSSASETKKITVIDLVGNATTLIADATIPGAKILFSSGQVAGSALVSSSITATQLGSKAVSAAKLGDESTVDLVTSLPATGAFVGQLALDTATLKVSCWDGSQWRSIKAAGSVNTVVGTGSGVVNVSATTSGDTVTITTSLSNTSAGGQFLGGPAGAAGAASFRNIVSSDLPTATSGAKGTVIVNGDGLRMSDDTIQINNDVTANSSTYGVVQYSSKGLVTAGRGITSVDLPVATSGAIGAVKPGNGLAVDNLGGLNHSNAVTASTATKVTYDSQGHITTGAALAATDIPSLPASILTSGTISPSLLGAKSIGGSKLGNYSTAQISNAAPTAEYIGQLFFNPLDRTLFMWDGNVYQPIGVSYGQVIFAGTYDAATNLVKSVTAEGQAIGLAVGAALPAPVTANKAHYVVVDEAGTGTAPAPTISLSPPDILLSTGTEWVQLDVSDTVVAQLASNVQVVPAGNMSSNNVQAALQELDTEKLPIAGGRLEGNLELGLGRTIIYEGSPDDAFETTLTVAGPTADRTITLPDATGTIVTTGDTGTVTSTMIADATIVNADINASAAIADTKLATISTAGKVSNSATTATNANTASAIVARDASGNFTAGTITAALTGAASSNVLKAGDTMTGALGVTAGTAAAPSLFVSGSTNTGLYSPGAGQVAISSNGQGRLYIDASGNVGIKGSSVITTSAASAPTFQIGDGVGSPALVMYSATTGASQISFADSTTGAGSYDGYILYSQNSQYLEFGTAASPRLRITAAGNVGVGTSNVTGSNTQLEVAGGTATELKIGATSANNANFRGIRFGVTGDSVDYSGIRFSPNSGELRTESGFSGWGGFQTFYTNGVERLKIDSLGRCGIGTTIPGFTLDVAGEARIGAADTSAAGLEIGTGATGNRSARIDLVGDTTYVDYGLRIIRNSAGANTRSDIIHRGTGDFLLNAADAASITFATNATERARLTSDGKFLVGTSSARSSGALGTGLHQVESSTYAISQLFSNGTGADGSYIGLWKSRGGTIGSTTIVQSGDIVGGIYFGGSDGTNLITNATITSVVDGTPGANDMPGRLVFSTTADGAASPTERMRIQSDGRILLNTTSPANVGGLAPRNVFSHSSGSQWAASVQHTAAAGSPFGLAISYTASTPNNTSSDFLWCDDATAARARIYSNGGLANYQANNVNLSDINTKKDISPAADTWNCLKEWEIVNYRYKDQPNDADLNLGVIAQQVAESCPEVITIFQEATEATEDKPAQEERLGVKEQQMYWMAIKALQQAQARIEALEADVAQLKGA